MVGEDINLFLFSIVWDFQKIIFDFKILNFEIVENDLKLNPSKSEFANFSEKVLFLQKRKRHYYFESQSTGTYFETSHKKYNFHTLVMNFDTF